ncbi:hypothetical protein DH2020_014958 [Rehmannia glutinosa]|uniref:Uncharacterized protein n=1 Tax=Rehmannia glutinosa TaxID=99300 RepID=A0ABR0WXY5_REHGL
MAHKQLLHELLKEDQEPFHLKSYISDKRSQLKKSSPKTTNLQIKKRKSNISSEIDSTKRGTNLRKHACFFSFQNYSPDVRKSPIIDFHVPSKTADLLVEAAMRIKNRSKPKAQVKNVGLGLIGSFLKILKDRSRNKKRGIGGNEFSVLRNCEVKEKETCEGLNRGDVEASVSTCWTEELDEIVNGDFAVRDMRFCTSPFRFSLHKSASSSGRQTPDFCSPAVSPSRRVKQKENSTTGEDSDNALHVVEEEKEQSSPVSVLDPFFENDGHESIDAEEEDAYDLECSYANVQRAKEQLLYRLRRFEKLAELDPMELEKNLLEDSDDEYQLESVESEDDDDDKPILSLYRKQSVETFVNEMFSFQHNNSRKIMSTDHKNNKIICLGKRRFVLKEVEFDTIDTMVELDLTIGFDGRKNIPERIEETAAELELAIFGVLVEELSEEFFYRDEQHQDMLIT